MRWKIYNVPKCLRPQSVQMCLHPWRTVGHSSVPLYLITPVYQDIFDTRWYKAASRSWIWRANIQVEQQSYKRCPKLSNRKNRRQDSLSSTFMYVLGVPTFLPVFSITLEASADPATWTAPSIIACWLGVSTRPVPSEALAKISPAKLSTGTAPQTSLAKAMTIAILNARKRILSVTEIKY